MTAGVIDRLEHQEGTAAAIGLVSDLVLRRHERDHTAVFRAFVQFLKLAVGVDQYDIVRVIFLKILRDLEKRRSRRIVVSLSADRQRIVFFQVLLHLISFLR